MALSCHAALKQGSCDFRIIQTGIITRRLCLWTFTAVYEIRVVNTNSSFPPLQLVISCPHCQRPFSFSELCSEYLIPLYKMLSRPGSTNLSLSPSADEALDIEKKFLRSASKQA